MHTCIKLPIFSTERKQYATYTQTNYLLFRGTTVPTVAIILSDLKP